MIKLRAFWDWLSGKKRNLALCYWSILLPSLAIIYPNGVPVNLNKTVLVLGVAFSALGITHSVAKSRAAKLEQENVE